MATSYFHETLGLSYGPINPGLERVCGTEGAATAISLGFDLAYGPTNTPVGTPNLAGNMTGEMHRIRSDQGEGPHTNDWTAVAVQMPVELLDRIAKPNYQITDGFDVGPNHAIATARVVVHNNNTALLLDRIGQDGSHTQLIVSGGQNSDKPGIKKHYDLWIPFGGTQNDPENQQRRLHLTTTAGQTIISQIRTSEQKQIAAPNGLDYEIVATETPGPNDQPSRTIVCRHGISSEYYAWKPSEEDRVPGPGVIALNNLVSDLSLFRTTSSRGQTYDLLNHAGVNRYNLTNGTEFGPQALIAMHLGMLGTQELTHVIQKALPSI